MRCSFRRGVVAIILLGVLTAAFAETPDERCQKDRYAAAAKYARCQENVVAKLYGRGNFSTPFNSARRAARKCRAKYADLWSKIQSHVAGSGTTCDNPRFADNGDGTVTDRLTGFDWEQKTALDGTANPADPHDADNRYALSSASGSPAGDGSALTDFLRQLNFPCFAGHCDWRLPDLKELQTIQSATCGSTCIDPAFAPTQADFVWSTTPFVLLAGSGWNVDFGSGDISETNLDATMFVRAVRGGL